MYKYKGAKFIKCAWATEMLPDVLTPFNLAKAFKASE